MSKELRNMDSSFQISEILKREVFSNSGSKIILNGFKKAFSPIILSDWANSSPNYQFPPVGKTKADSHKSFL